MGVCGLVWRGTRGLFAQGEHALLSGSRLSAVGSMGGEGGVIFGVTIVFDVIENESVTENLEDKSL